MSWVRWGSKCSGLYGPTPEAEKANEACPDSTCPGSAVYIFDAAEGYECCGCWLQPGDVIDARFRTKSGAEMVAHLKEHIAAGHHVAASLLFPVEDWKEW